MIDSSCKGQLEQGWLDQKILPIGVDEVGRGCIAGPVFAGAAVLNYPLLSALPDNEKKLIRDSKTLSEKQRYKALEIISKISRSTACAKSTEREIESLGIVQATHLAMLRAIESLGLDSFEKTVLAVDGNAQVLNYSGAQKTVIKGDSLCFCIAAASIIAKIKRDEWMKSIAESHPEYGFQKHVGYGTKIHLDAIDHYGVLDIHRRNFAPIKNIINFDN